MRFTAADQFAAFAEGWGVFTTTEPERPLEIQRLDEVSVFDCDEAAWRHVVKAAFLGCRIAGRALATIRAEAPAEYAAIQLVVMGAFR